MERQKGSKRGRSYNLHISTWLVTTGGDIEVAFDGPAEKFKSSNDYYDEGKTRRVTFTGLTKVEGSTMLSQIGVTYNAANQVTAVTADGNTATYAYDAGQRLNQITYPSAEVVKYGFNSRGLLESIKDGSNAAIADYTFDDAGRLTKKSLPNGLECVYEYNDANWVTKITLRQTANPSTVLQSFQYGYNKVGNRTWVAYADGSGDVYQYDGTDQLIGVKYGVSNPQDGYAAAIGENQSVSYTYDALGNRVVMLDNVTTTNYTVNNLNQYTQIDLNSYTYDTNGNLTGDGTWTFGYDQEGHLISASKSGTSVSYKYDAMGRRIEKNVNGTVTKFVYSGLDLIEERDGSSNLLAKYVYAGGIDNPVKVIKGDSTYYFQQDALGNVTALTNGSGAIVESYTYDAFGKPKIKDEGGSVIATPVTPFLFTGREYDAETGLYHYRSRAYSPEFGRFLQMDSIGFKGNDRNLYRYVGNNPANEIDALGLCSDDCKALWGRMLRKATDLLGDLQRYDPYEDGKGGPIWKPGGHYQEIKERQAGLKNDIAKYVKNCIIKKDPCDKPCPGSQVFDELANRQIEPPAKFATNPFLDQVLPPMLPAGGLPIPAPIIP